MPVVDRAVVDTNVLLAASDAARSEHGRALDEWLRRGATLYTSGQILREYLSVATRPTAHNGLGMQRGGAAANVHQFRSRMRFLAEDSKVADRLLALLDAVPCTGNQVHDANIVATALVNGIDTVTTLKTADFGRFADHIRVAGVVG